MKEMVFYHTTRWLLTIYYILAACSLVGALIVFLIGKMGTTAIGCLLLTAFFLLYPLFFHRRTVKRMYESSRLLYGQEILQEAAFYEEGFFVWVDTQDVSSQLEVAYSKVKKVIETKHLWMLKIKDNLVYVAKDGFTKGDREEFRAFIREKTGK